MRANVNKFQRQKLKNINHLADGNSGMVNE